MQNRLDTQLSPANLQQIITEINQIISQLPQVATLTGKETKKGGWHLSQKSIEMAKRTLYTINEQPTYFPHIVAANMEKDIAYWSEISLILDATQNLENILSDTKRVLMKEINEQATYAYQQIKIMHDNGIPEGAAYKELKELMPKTGKKKKIKE